MVYSTNFHEPELPTLLHTPVASAHDMSCMQVKPVPSDSLPHFDLMKSEDRKEIIEDRKYYNLAEMLSASIEAGNYRMFKFSEEGEQIPMKEDIRFKRPLTLGEFIKAFGFHKSVFCEAFPHRREEMDRYQRLSLFYEYHRMFTPGPHLLLQKALSLTGVSLIQRFTLLSHHEDTRACSISHSLTHTSEFCFLTSKRDTTFHPYNHNHDSHVSPHNIIGETDFVITSTTEDAKGTPASLPTNVSTPVKQGMAKWIVLKQISGKKRGSVL